MFLWLEVNLEKHPDYRTNLRETSGDSTGPQTNTDELMQKLFELAIEGEHFISTLARRTMLTSHSIRRERACTSILHLCFRSFLLFGICKSSRAESSFDAQAGRIESD